MKLTTARTLAGVYFVLMLVFVTWPGLVPFSRVEPLILGLPFSMAWIAAWIAGSVLVLWGLDRVEGRYREAGDPRADPAVGPLGLQDQPPGTSLGGVEVTSSNDDPPRSPDATGRTD
ncbi:MAG: DUF3311 domain-containing protein [Longimicrobiales bacterium]|nr:DUF3311 domain-containing protein [Longimicrobiales bacterium]